MEFLVGTCAKVALLALMLCGGCSSLDGAGGTSGEGGRAGGAGGAVGAGGAATSDLEWPPDATAYFDQFGILNADCATDEDCAMVLGYYHARDRFVQMDLQRRFASGSITSIVNKGLLEAIPNGVETLVRVATANRALFSNRNGEPLEEVFLQTTSPKTLGLFEAYAAGVNRWLDDVRSGRNGAQWPREFDSVFLDYQPEDAPDWKPTDSVASVLFIVDLQTNREDWQIDAGAARAEISDPARFSDLFSRRPDGRGTVLEPEEHRTSQDEASTLGTWWNSDLIKRAAPAFAKLRKPISRFLGIGSNNWVVGPAMTANGGTLLSDDPHLNMSQPAIWYLAHLDAKTHGSGEIHAAGLTIAGLPYVIVGQNEDIAWGTTNAVLDLSDIYAEELVLDGNGAPLGARQDSAVVEFIKVETTFEFNDGTVSEPQVLLFHPNHGPVRSIDIENRVALTLRWSAQDATTDLDFFTEASRAGSVEEFREAATTVTTLGQSWVSIDRQGNFGWFPYSRIPKRPWATEAPTWLPIDGTGAYEWEGYFDFSELPQSLNRDRGYIATTNNDQTGTLADGDPNNDGHPPFQTDAAAGFRHERIAELLEQSDAHTMDSMLTIVGDTRSLYGQNMTPKILEFSDGLSLTANATKVVDALRPWTYDCPSGLRGSDPVSSPLAAPDEVTESAGCAAFHVLLNELEERLANDEPHFGWSITYTSVVEPSLLAAGDVYWDDVRTENVVETKDDIMTAALEAAGQKLAEKLGDDASQWAWGRMHGVVLRSDLSALSSFFSEFNNPPNSESFYSTPGGLRTVNVAPPGPEGIHTAGVSGRLICEGLPAGMSCTVQVPGGQSAHVDSPNYADLLPLWLRNEPIDLVFDIEEASASAVTKVTFE